MAELADSLKEASRRAGRAGLRRLARTTSRWAVDETPTPSSAPPAPAEAASPAAELYISLLLRCITRTGFGEPQPEAELGEELDAATRKELEEHLRARGLMVVRAPQADPAVREVGKDWPSEAETMIGMVRARYLADCVKRVVSEGVPGDLLEAGVWRGGACILMRGVLEALGDTARRVWVADSFEGLPKPDPERYPADEGDDLWTFDELAVSLEQVQANFSRYGLLDARVRFLKGWFEDTLPTAPISQLAVLRLDGDLYASTTQALTALYPKLSPGGYCIIDDYGAVPACAAAVEDYRSANGIEEPIEQIDWTGVAWRRQ